MKLPLFKMLFAGATLALSATMAHAAENKLPLKQHHWAFQGPLGTYDRAALQRGYQVYKEVCSSCHSLNYLSYRNLSDEGGPGFTPAQVEVLAAQSQVPAGPADNGDVTDENGQIRMRPALPSDKFAHPFQNDNAARASNNGALPPDLSLITKARQGGPDYVYSFVSGFADAPNERPACVGETPGMHYNQYFTDGAGGLPEACKDEKGETVISGGLTAMPPQLTADRVTFADGTPATTEQMASDVVTFLTWAGDPHMEARKHMGFEVLIYLIILAGFLYVCYKKVWSGVEH